MIKFALIGDGAVAKYHKKAIEYVGGDLRYIIDPKYALEYKKTRTSLDTWAEILPNIHFPHYIDYAVICSPTQFHRPQIQEILKAGHILRGIICEKPAFLPWEPPIIDDRINIVLQLRYLPNFPEKADLVSVRFVRDEAYFKSWKGDARETGGLFYNLFIHYIDLAISLGADFEGVVAEHGKQERWIGTKWSWTNGLCSESQRIDPVKYIDDKNKIDILNINTQVCYNKMYEAILEGNGIKPSDLFYLNWMLQRNSEIFGYGRDGIGKTITIKNELM